MFVYLTKLLIQFLTNVYFHLLDFPLLQLFLFSVSLALLVHFIFSSSSQWKGLPGAQRTFWFGNRTPGDSEYNDVIKHHKAMEGHKFSVYYNYRVPRLVLHDPDLIRAAMVSGHEHFNSFAFLDHTYQRMLGNQLGLADALGEEWKTMRKMANPPFSLISLKKLIPGMNSVNKQMINYLDEATRHEQIFNINEIVLKYVMNFIASVAFGFDVDCFKDPNNKFKTRGDDLFNTGFKMDWILKWPKIAGLLQFGLFNKKSAKFFTEVCKQNIKMRREGLGNTEKDVLGILVKASGEFSGMTDDIMIKTCLQFFSDGYETTSHVIIGMIYHLAKNPDVMERLQEEIDQLFEDKSSEELTTEDVGKLKYLDQFVLEGLRVMGVLFSLRRCTKEWSIPGTDIKILKGTSVLFPIAPLHFDPKYWQDPELFNPSRFSPENKGEQKTQAFFPFGVGPRMCIGQNMVKLETKMLLIPLIRMYRLETCHKTVDSIEYDADLAVSVMMKSQIFLKIVKRTV